MSPAFWRGFWHGAAWPWGIFNREWRAEWRRIMRGAPPSKGGERE